MGMFNSFDDLEDYAKDQDLQDVARRGGMDPVTAYAYDRTNKPKGGGGAAGGASQRELLSADTLLLSGGMPSLTDSDRRNAARRQRASMLTRGGRSSTILTDLDPLGGGI